MLISNRRQFQLLGFLIPFVASAGSLDFRLRFRHAFSRPARTGRGRSLLYRDRHHSCSPRNFTPPTPRSSFWFLFRFTANATHSILGTAAAMDIGGAKMAGFASGVIDSFQYFGGSLAGYFLGALLDKSWGNYFYFMAPFG